MSAGKRWWPLLVALLLLLGACGWLFQLRLGGGDLYPPYSSLRTDALGTRALYEALASVPGLQVERDYRPLDRLPAQPRLVVLPGQIWQDWVEAPVDELSALNAAAAGGARVLLAFRADQRREERDEHGRPVVKDDEEKKSDTDTNTDKAKTDKAKPEKTKPGKGSGGDKAGQKKNAGHPGMKERERIGLAKAWEVTLKQRWLMTHQAGAQREPAAGADLPPQVAWKSDLYFSTPAGSGWRVLYRRGNEPVLIEKTIGRGSIVLLADGYCLSNESMHRDRATALLSWLVGSQHHVTFLEGSLGVLEGNGVGYLARRYGLGGALALSVLLGLLYAWRQLVAFMPPAREELASSEVALAYEPTAGFTGLLRRALGAGELLPACLAEWRKARPGGGSPAALARLEVAWQARDPQHPLSSTYNALVQALKPR